MPEGDTIWRTANQLRPRLVGKRITRAGPETFERLVGSTVTDVSPNGKHLLVHFDNGLVLHSHMRIACRNQGDPPRFTYYCPKCQQSELSAAHTR